MSQIVSLRRWAIRVLILAAVAAAAWWLVDAYLVEDPVPVTVFRVERGSVEETVTNSRAGTVRARRRARLSPQVGGRVIDLPFREGDTVAKGQVLLRLDDSDLAANEDLAFRETEASLAREKEACLTADLARRELERAIELFDDGITTQERLDRLESERNRADAGCSAAAAAVKRALAAVELARAQREKTVIYAPFDGVLAAVDTELGEWVTPAPPAVPVPPVLDLIQPGSIYVSAPLDEVDAARVRPGLPSRITADPYPTTDFPARLIRVAPFVEDIQEQNRTFEVELEFEDAAAAGSLLPGTSADIEVILDRREAVLRIPSYALLGQNQVLIFASGRLAERQVEIGLRNWEFAEILSGLSEGETVVVSLDRVEVVAGAPAFVERELGP